MFEMPSTGEKGPARFRDPFDPEPWAAQSRRFAPNLTRDEGVIERLRAALRQGDPEADTLVEWMHQRGMQDGRRLFEQALEHGISSVPDADSPLRHFFSTIDPVPVWLDREKLVRACRAYDRSSFVGEYVLFSVSLLGGYVSSGIAKTLVSTGALERMAPRRLAETSKFVEDVYQSRTVHRSSDGFRTTARVRVMHALVRRHLLRSGWDVDAWGVPINQADMAATILQFSITYLLGLRGLGVHVSREDGAALMHLWRYVGRLSGVADDLLPVNEAEGQNLLRLMVASQPGPDDDSRALARALLAVPEQRAGRGGAQWLVHADVQLRAALARLAIGRRAADGLGLPDTAWQLLPVAAIPAVHTVETLRRIVPGATWLAERYGRALSARRVRRWLDDRPPTFVPRGAASGAVG